MKFANLFGAMNETQLQHLLKLDKNYLEAILRKHCITVFICLAMKMIRQICSMSLCIIMFIVVNVLGFESLHDNIV